jgi:5-methylcytosine-specific restriction protein A
MRVNLIAEKSQRKEKEEVHQINFTVRIDGQKQQERLKKDHYLCQACLHNLDGAGVRYTTDALEVHHIVPVSEDWDLRFDWSNLITLCRCHHELAESGALGRCALQKLNEQQHPPGGS